MVVGVIAPIVGTALRTAGRYVVRAINLQDDVLNNVLRTAPSRNMLGRGGIRGIRHGLAGGALASPFIEELKGSYNEFQTPKTQRTPSNKFQKKYRSVGRYSSSRSGKRRQFRCRCRRNARSRSY